MTSDDTNLAIALEGQHLLFALIGRIIYSAPEIDWLNTLIEQDVFSEPCYGENIPELLNGLNLLHSWCRTHRNVNLKKAVQTLQAEYHRLVSGLGLMLIPPWESVYFNSSRLIFQKETLQVRQWYRRFGLESARIHEEPDDHIGLEMIFVAHLARLALEALQEGRMDLFEKYMRSRRDFLREHPLRWGPAWCDLLLKHARTDFFRGLANLTKGALLAAASDLGIYCCGPEADMNVFTPEQ